MTPTIRLLHAALLLSACGAGAGGTAASSNAAEAVTAPAAVEAPAPVVSAPGAGTLPSAEAPQASTPAKADAATIASHATMVAEMRRMLVGKATLDGDAITDVRQVDACHTDFATAKGNTVIDWTKGGNIAPRQQGGRELNDLPGGDGTHPLSMPTGSDADGVSGAFGLLVAECTQ